MDGGEGFEPSQSEPKDKDNLKSFITMNGLLTILVKARRDRLFKTLGFVASVIQPTNEEYHP